MKAAQAPNPDLLKRIRRTFARRRRGDYSKVKRYSPTLRRLAAAAVSGGHMPGVVAEAAGVNRQSIVNWCIKQGAGAQKRKSRSISRRPCPSPVELKIVKSRVDLPAIPETSQTIVRILFRGGASMECHVSAVSAQLVAALNGGGP